jgi:ribonuclease P protein component
MTGEGFPQSARLKNNADFRAVMDHRRKLADGLLTVFAAPNGLAVSRLGVSVGRAGGGAVWRNRVKRLMREVWRRKMSAMPQGHDYVVMMTRKNRPDMPTYEDMQRSLGSLLDQLKTRNQ